MKKTIIISMLSLVVFACSHKTASTTSTITTTTEKPEMAEKSSSATVSNAEYLAGKYIYQDKCATCHKLKEPSMGNMTQWTKWINIMAPKAKCTEAEKAQITKFISVNALQE